MEKVKDRSLFYLKGILYIHIIALVLSTFVYGAFIKDSASSNVVYYLKQIPNVLVAFCLIKLCGRFRLPGILKIVYVGLSIWPLIFHNCLLPVVYYILPNPILLFFLYGPSYISIIVFLAALTLEYIAYASFFPADKKKWYIMLACTFTFSLASYLFAILIPQSVLQNLSSLFIARWNETVQFLQKAAGLIYCVLLWYSIRNYEKSKKQEKQIW